MLRMQMNFTRHLPRKGVQVKVVRRWLLSAIGAAVIMLAPALATGPAQAAPTADFTSQARSAGLTAAQAEALQKEVDTYLATMGGTQISANQIDLHGGTLSVPVPGEARPRAFGTSDVHCENGADYQYFCAYSDTYFNGANIAWWACGVEKAIPWYTEGSWDNNQTAGTRARIYYHDSSALTPAAPSLRFYGVNWADITRIKAC